MPRRKKRAAWASITEVERGTVYRIRYWGKGADGEYRRRSKTIRGTRLDAERARSELMLAHSEDAPCPTVGEVWRSYVLPEIDCRVEDGDLSPRTRTAYVRCWASVVEPSWSNIQCDAVRPLAVQQWISQLTLSQARRAVQVMSLVFVHAVRYGLCDHNPMREKYLMPSKSTVRRRDTGVWTLDELGEVWQAVRAGAPWMEPAFLVAAFGGARVSESLGVIAGEVERVECSGVPVALVPILRQITKEDGVTDRLKTERSRRVAVVPGRAGEVLAKTAASLPASVWLTNDGLGGWCSRDRLNDAWNRRVLPLLPEGQRHLFQSLRNSWQTNCRWTLGMPPEYVEPLMGHAGRGVTGQFYDRPRTLMLADAVAKAYAAHPYDADWDWATWADLGRNPSEQAT